jgi:hypothetical protein
MIEAIHSVLAGIHVHRTWLNRSADNIANSRTAGFRAAPVLPRDGGTDAPSPYAIRGTDFRFCVR